MKTVFCWAIRAVMKNETTKNEQKVYREAINSLIVEQTIPNLEMCSLLCNLGQQCAVEM
ncbi:hypothetical protein ALT721_2320062 [Alteromonas alvinellae]